MLKDFSLDGVKKISTEDLFVREFLHLALMNIEETIIKCSIAIRNRSIEDYRSIIHKIRTTMLMTGMDQLNTFLKEGKEIILNGSAEECQDYYQKVKSTFFSLIETIESQL